MESSWKPCGSKTSEIFTTRMNIIVLVLNVFRWYIGIPLLRECSTLCDFIFGELSEDVVQSPAILANVFGFPIPGESQVHLRYTIRKDATAYRLWRPWFDRGRMTTLATFWGCRSNIIPKDQFWTFVLKPDAHGLQVSIISRDVSMIVWSYLLKFGWNGFIPVRYRRLNLLGHSSDNVGTCTRGTSTFTFHPVFCRIHKDVLEIIFNPAPRHYSMSRMCCCSREWKWWSNILKVASSTVVNIYCCCAWIPMFCTVYGLAIG